MTDEDLLYMRMALREAEKAPEHGDVPVGAVIVFKGQVIARAHNQVELLKDPTAHAEILAITQAASYFQEIEAKQKRLEGTTMYVTLEPCAMCAGGLVQARVNHLVYGAHDEKFGGCGSIVDVLGAPRINHSVVVTSGVEKEASESLLRVFFGELRN